MAKCVFCGEKAAVGKTVHVASFDFKACPDCFERLKNASDERIYGEAYRAGLYSDMDRLTQRLLEKRDAYLKNLADYNEFITENACGQCPRCGGAMVRRSRIKLLMSDEGLFPSLDVTQWNTSDFEVEPHICESCGYIDFYDPVVIERQNKFAQRAADLDWLLKEDEQQDD